MGIIVGNSGSMRPKRQKVESAALGLVKASNPQDEVFIVNFNDDAPGRAVTPMTSRRWRKASRVSTRAGGTAMARCHQHVDR
jgi:hypothetical protein